MLNIEALAQPIIQLLGSFGSGVLPTGSPADALRLSSAAIDQVHATGKTSIAAMEGSWDGKAANAAVAKASEAQGSAVKISDRGNSIADVVGVAAADVNAGMAELTGILQSFIGILGAAGPALLTPPGQMMIVGAAIEHLNRALVVVAKVRAQLTEHTAKMAELTPAEHVPTEAAGTAPAATTPASTNPAAAVGNAFSSGFQQTASSGVSSMMAPVSSAMTMPATASTTSSSKPSHNSLLGDKKSSTTSTTKDGGVVITLPDGSTTVAPNETAAKAVQTALTAQGTPYVYGGTDPKNGIDCSALTQWAYREAGLEIPRVAENQHEGKMQVDPDELMPGDLAVWKGHVAMVIGNGQLVEAGSPVQVGPIRQTNSGMEFYGFYRPTENA